MCVAGKSFRRHHKLHVMCVEYNISIRFFSFFGKYYVDALRLIAFIVFTFSCICCFLLLVLLLLLLLYAEPKKPHPHLHTAHTSFINIVGCQNGLHTPPREDDEKNTGTARASNRCYLITFFYVVFLFAFSLFCSLLVALCIAEARNALRSLRKPYTFERNPCVFDT